jgi:hypothetical protein
MELTPQEIDLIDRHFRNELTKEEEAAFNSRLVSDTVFADELENYKKSIEAIGEIGRRQLKSEFIAIQKEVENSEGYDSYKPGNIKKLRRGGSGYIGFTIFILLVAAGIYYYNTHKEHLDKIDNMFVPSEPDTVYHYRVKKDTVKTRMEKKYKIIDTIYYDQNGNRINKKAMKSNFPNYEGAYKLQNSDSPHQSQ